MSNFSGKKIIGLTGMSGAGKSTVCRLLQEKGWEIIDCDIISREVVEPNSPCLKEIADSFGENFITESGNLDRRLMGAAIFSDFDKRMLLNSIIYPYISYTVIGRVASSERKYIVIDAPTLFESGIDDICDIIVSVVADREALALRIMKRDNITYDQAISRLSSQFDKNFYIEKSDFHIENDGDIDKLRFMTMEIAEKIERDNDKEKI